MARLRVSGRQVWRRAGGRRGPEPVFSTTSAEIDLPWETAAAGSTPTIDGWGTAPPQPTRRRYAHAAFVLACAFVPVVAAAASAQETAAVQGGQPPSATRTLQYQTYTGPVAVPAAAPAVLTDWIAQSPQPPRRSAWQPAQATTAPVLVPDVTQPVTALSWQPQYPDRISPRPRAPEFPQAVAPLFVPDVTTPAPGLSWASSYPARVPSRPRPPVDTTVSPVLVEAPAEVVTLDKWAGRYPDVARQTARPATSGAAPVFVPDVTQPVVPLSWVPVYPSRIPPRPRATEFPQAVAPIFVPDVTVVAPARSWSPTYPDHVARIVRPTSNSVGPLYVPDVTVAVPALSWNPTFPDRLARVSRAIIESTVGPVFVPPSSEVVTSDKWCPTHPSILRAKPQVAAGYSVGPLYVPDVTYPVTPLSWSTQTAVPVRGKVSPVTSLAEPPFVEAAPEVITVDKWQISPARVIQRAVIVPPSTTVAPIDPIAAPVVVFPNIGTVTMLPPHRFSRQLPRQQPEGGAPAPAIFTTVVPPTLFSGEISLVGRYDPALSISGVYNSSMALVAVYAPSVTLVARYQSSLQLLGVYSATIRLYGRR